MKLFQESIIRDATARNRVALRSTVNASKLISFVLKIVSAWTAKITKGAMRGKLFFMVIMPTTSHLSSRQQMLPSPEPLDHLVMGLHL